MAARHPPQQMPASLACLICGQQQAKNSFLTHIAEHLNYRQHKCQDCDFESITVEEMADHESCNPEHMSQLYALRNPYMDRVCRFIYNDCDYGERNGGDLQRVLKRRLVSALEEEGSSGGGGTAQHRQQNNNNKSLRTTEECTLPSPKVMGNAGETGTLIDGGGLLQHQQQSTAMRPTAAFDHCQQQQWNNTCIDANSLAQQQQPVSHLSSLSTVDCFGSIKNEFAAAGGGCSATATAHLTEGFTDANDIGCCSVLEKLIAQQQPQLMTHIGIGAGNLFDNGIAAHEGEGIHHQMDGFFYNGMLNDKLEEGDEEQDEMTSEQQMGMSDNNRGTTTTTGGGVGANGNGKKKYKETFDNVQCLKCGQWVKGRGICLLYHMNTRHLKLPLYRCRACPRDFFYVTDTTAKNHIRSFHANDLSLLENNYGALSKILHDSRKEFYGLSKSEKRAAAMAALSNAKKVKGCGAKSNNRKMKKGKGGGGKRHYQEMGANQQQKQQQSSKKEINFRERPQAGSGTAGNSSHVQCHQCGDMVATIYSSQLSHINTKHLHLAIFECRFCQRQFESLSSSAAMMHVKSIHRMKSRMESELHIVDRRDECLRQLNEQYRTFFP